MNVAAGASRAATGTGGMSDQTAHEATESGTVPIVADAIADRLGETGDLPRRQVRRVVQALGAGRAHAFLAEALALEAAGGELLPDGSRRRTPGGVFFRLVRRGTTAKERGAIFLPAAPALPAAPPYTWEEYAALGPALRDGAGEATRVKITVIGRPRQVTPQGELVVPLVSERVPTVPKGLPLPEPGTAYAVLVARKQWQKVASALADPAERLIAEGYPTLRPGFDGITVLATNVTTTGLQAAKRQAQQVPGGPG